MTATTDHYLGIDVHKRQAQVAILDDEGAVVGEIAEKYEGSRAAIEAGSNYFTIYDRLDEQLDVTLANPAKADWLEDQKQKNDCKDAKNLARHCLDESLRNEQVVARSVHATRQPAQRELRRGS